MTDPRPWWRQLGTRLRRGPEPERTPDVATTLETAIAGLREQHALVTAQAAEIVAAEGQQRAHLDRALAEQERRTASAEQAVRRVDEESAVGRRHEADRWEATAEALAGRIQSLEREIDYRGVAGHAAAEASARARSTVDQSASVVRSRIAEYQRLLSDLGQAQIQEQLNDTLGRSEPGRDGAGPTTEAVRRTIAERLATAQALTEIRSEPASGRHLELERGPSRVDARARVDQMARDLTQRPDADAEPSDGGTTG